MLFRQILNYENSQKFLPKNLGNSKNYINFVSIITLKGLRSKPETKKQINIMNPNRNFETIFLRVRYAASEVDERGDYWTPPYYEYFVDIDEVILIGSDDEEFDLTYLFKSYQPLIHELERYYKDGVGNFTREVELNVPSDFYYSNNLNEYYDECE